MQPLFSLVQHHFFLALDQPVVQWPMPARQSNGLEVVTEPLVGVGIGALVGAGIGMMGAGAGAGPVGPGTQLDASAGQNAQNVHCVPTALCA